MPEFFWPCDLRYDVIQNFGVNQKNYPNWPGHPGLDFGDRSNGTMPEGLPIYAVQVGQVYHTGYDPTEGGEFIILEHMDGCWTTYNHLSRINVIQGQRIACGEEIGRSGHSPNTTPHLHFGWMPNPHNVPQSDLYYGFANPKDYLIKEKCTMTQRSMGADVSLWDADGSHAQYVNFAKMKSAGASFVYIKASQATLKDQDIVYNWVSAKKAGLLRGAYHFLVWNVDASQQADFFCKTLGDDLGELPLICDFEWWGTIPSNAKDILWAFLDKTYHNTGKKPGIYTAKSFWDQYGTNDPAWLEFPLWVANYGPSTPAVPKPWGPDGWTFWQYSSTGDGILYGCVSKGVDLNVFNGTDAELRAKYSAGVLPVGTIPSDHEIVMRLWKIHPEIHD